MRYLLNGSLTIEQVQYRTGHELAPATDAEMTLYLLVNTSAVIASLLASGESRLFIVGSTPYVLHRHYFNEVP